MVAAVGAGRLFRKYRPHPTDPRKRTYTETNQLIPCEVKPGVVVELGGLNVFDGLGYNFPQVIIGTERFLICQEQDVCFVHEGPWCCEKGQAAGMSVCRECAELFGSQPDSKQPKRGAVA